MGTEQFWNQAAHQVGVSVAEGLHAGPDGLTVSGVLLEVVQ